MGTILLLHVEIIAAKRNAVHGVRKCFLVGLFNLPFAASKAVEREGKETHAMKATET